MRKCAVAAAVLLLVLLLTWFVLPTGSDAPPAPGASQVGDAGTTAQERVERRQAAEAAPASDASPNGPNSDESTPAAVPIHEPDEETTRRRYTVQVVDATSSKPVAGIRVAYLAPDPEVWTPDVRLGPAPVDRLFELGTTLTTDRHGRVAFPLDQRYVVVAARHGDLLAHAMFTARSYTDGWTLSLVTPRRFRVAVVDGQGQEVPDAIVACVETRSRREAVLGRARTGPYGEPAVFQLLVQDKEGDAPDRWLTVAGQFHEPPRAPVDLSSPPGDVVRLVLPPSGHVLCEVVTHTGEPAPNGLVVRLRGVGGPGKPPGLRAALELTALTDAGVASFPHVAPNHELLLDCPEDRTRVTSHARFPGPSEAGETARSRFTLGPPRPRLTGRIIDGDGKGVAGLKLVLEFLVTGRSRPPRSALRRTDADGRYAFALDQAPGPLPADRVRIGRKYTYGAGFETTSAIGELELPAQIGASDTELGDLVFHGRGQLLSGRVLGPDGEPVAGARVAVMQSRYGRRSPVRGVPAVVTGADGAFVLRGRVDEDFPIGVTLDGYFVAEPSTYGPGTKGATVRLARAGGIAASFRPPPGGSSSGVRLVIQGPPVNNGDGGYRSGPSSMDARVRDGLVEVLNLRPGTARVQVRLGHRERDTVLTVDDVVVVAGQVTRDPRLQDVDPAAFTSSLSVTVLGSDRRPLPHAVVHFRESGQPSAAYHRARCDAAGVALIRSTKIAAGLEALAASPGYLSVCVERLHDSTTVVLSPAEPSKVTVRLAPDSILPEPPFHVEVRLLYAGWGEVPQLTMTDPRHGRSWQREFDDDRTVRFDVDEPGHYLVQLILWKRSLGRGSGTGIATSPPRQTVIVREPGTTAEITVTIDREECDKTMTRKRD